jgi:formate hydrogenlyase subunit 6/NADH:ubiquinone oxidoreductase subunit I
MPDMKDKKDIKDMNDMKDMKDATKPKTLATGDRTIPPEGARMIPLHIMGREYMVPETLTIMKAVEYAGYAYVRGCGCRGGICGACATFYRFIGDYRLKSGLACQTVAEPDMVIVQLPFFPANRPSYELQRAASGAHEELRRLYPEVFKCVGCGTCTRTCPMDIDVMDYIALMKRGDLKGAALKSFDCVMCGLCASRCPAQISQFTAAMFVRRVYGAHMVPPAAHLKKRVEEVSSGRYAGILDALASMKEDEVKRLYVEREREPDLAEPGKWMPKDTSRL